MLYGEKDLVEFSSLWFSEAQKIIGNFTAKVGKGDALFGDWKRRGEAEKSTNVIFYTWYIAKSKWFTAIEKWDFCLGIRPMNQTLPIIQQIFLPMNIEKSIVDKTSMCHLSWYFHSRAEKANKRSKLNGKL